MKKDYAAGNVSAEEQILIYFIEEEAEKAIDPVYGRVIA